MANTRIVSTPGSAHSMHAVQYFFFIFPSPHALDLFLSPMPVLDSLLVPSFRLQSCDTSH